MTSQTQAPKVVTPDFKAFTDEQLTFTGRKLALFVGKELKEARANKNVERIIVLMDVDFLRKRRSCKSWNLAQLTDRIVASNAEHNISFEVC